MINPLLQGFYPDPSVCFVEGKYYLANSSFEYFPGIPLHVSDDFETWYPIGHAVDRQSQLPLERAYDSGGLYAPALRFHRGTFYIACTSFGEPGAEGYGNFYLTASDPAGDWSDATFLPEARGFDPSLHFDGDIAWWIECRERDEPDYPGDTEIWMRQLDLETGKLVGQEHILWRAALRVGAWSEGPHIHFRNGWYYLITAEGGTEFDHAVMVARSRFLTGPYEGYSRNPLITHRSLGATAPVRNVGHADLVEGPDGQWRMVLLASRQIGGRVMLGRETFAADVDWQDDWPVVNPGEGRLLGVASRPMQTGWVTAQLQDFVTTRGEPKGAIDESGGILVVAGERDAGLWRRLQHTSADIAFEIELADAHAGVALTLRQSDSYCLSLTLRDGEATVIERRNGIDLSLGASAAGMTSTLGVTVTPSTVSFWVSEGGRVTQVGQASTDVLTTETAGGFVGTMFGIRPVGADGTSARVSRWSYDGR